MRPHVPPFLRFLPFPFSLSHGTNPLAWQLGSSIYLARNPLGLHVSMTRQVATQDEGCFVVSGTTDGWISRCQVAKMLHGVSLSHMQVERFAFFVDMGSTIRVLSLNRTALQSKIRVSHEDGMSSSKSIGPAQSGTGRISAYPHVGKPYTEVHTYNLVTVNGVNFKEGLDYLPSC
ncbi:hypothetical protein F5Y14DRAFT_396190 [Nemania sp. NC0429]|nr:hypothetical protein F5Y14DRAFT_396190 [Nemania sp. NC0429]